MDGPCMRVISAYMYGMDCILLHMKGGREGTEGSYIKAHHVPMCVWRHAYTTNVDWMQLRHWIQSPQRRALTHLHFYQNFRDPSFQSELLVDHSSLCNWIRNLREWEAMQEMRNRKMDYIRKYQQKLGRLCCIWECSKRYTEEDLQQS